MSMPQDPAAQGPHPRQRLLLVIAGALIAVAIVLVLVITLRGGSDGPAPGSPDAVTDQLATALRAHSAEQVAAVACAGVRSQLAGQTHAVLADNRSAQRDGSAHVNGAVAVNRIKLDVEQNDRLPGPSGAMTSSASSSVVATVALRREDGADWCVAAFAVALPTH